MTPDLRTQLGGPEWRLYYSTNAVSELFNETDFMLIALTHDRNLLLIFCPQGSQAEIQLRSLFGASETAIVDKLKAVPIYTTQLVIPIRLMLARYGIELECRKDDDNYLSQKPTLILRNKTFKRINILFFYFFL